MAQLLVTCPECGLTSELRTASKTLDDPDRECKNHLNLAKCPALRAPLIAAGRMLDFLEWEALVADEFLEPPLSTVAETDVPEPVYEQDGSGKVPLS